MSEIAAYLKITFLALVVFYVCIQVALLISEVRSAERAADAVPRAFRDKVSLEEHRKAIDFTAEIVQSDTLNALLGAAITLLFTLGGGIEFLWAFMSVLFNQGVASQFLFVMLILFFLALVDLPFDWWRNFRISERYGMERTEAKSWLKKRIQTTFIGWIADMPLVFALILILSLTSYFWWVICFIGCFSWYFWHEYLYPTYRVGFSKNLVELSDCSLKWRLTLLLKELGYPNTKIYTCKQPAALAHNHALFAQSGTTTHLVLFRHTLELLTEEEILAVSANAVSEVARWHRFARCAIFFILSCVFWMGFAWISEKGYFYSALGIHPSIALANGAAIPGLLLAIVITTFPVILYPIVFFVHSLTRRLEYDSDAYVVRTVGAVPLIRAIVKLHTDYRNSLTPNRLYSLANHRRPHITHRILAAEAEAEKLRTLAKRSREERISDRQELFNNILERREAEKANKAAHLIEAKREKLDESLNLLSHQYTAEP